MLNYFYFLFLNGTEWLGRVCDSRPINLAAPYVCFMVNLLEFLLRLLFLRFFFSYFLSFIEMFVKYSYHNIFLSYTRTLGDDVFAIFFPVFYLKSVLTFF